MLPVVDRPVQHVHWSVGREFELAAWQAGLPGAHVQSEPRPVN